MAENEVATVGAKSVGNKLTTRIGPLPAWAWAAIPAGGFIIWSYIRNASAGAGVNGDPAPAPVDEEYLNTGYPSITPSGGFVTAPSGSSNPPTVTQPPYTNTLWRRDAYNYLISQQIEPVMAVRVLDAYLKGLNIQLNVTEMNALQMAIGHLGEAPNGGKIPATEPGKAPTDPTMVEAKLTTATTIVVTWQPPQETNGIVLGYLISLRRDGNPIDQRITLPALRSVTFTNVPRGNYSVVAQARNVLGLSPGTRIVINVP
jgi:hypothetical protein